MFIRWVHGVAFPLLTNKLHQLWQGHEIMTAFAKQQKLCVQCNAWSSNLFKIGLSKLRRQLLPPALAKSVRGLCGSQFIQRRSLVTGDPVELLRGQSSGRRAARLWLVRRGLLLLLNDFSVLSKTQSW